MKEVSSRQRIACIGAWNGEKTQDVQGIARVTGPYGARSIGGVHQALGAGERIGGREGKKRDRHTMAHVRCLPWSDVGCE